MNVQRITPFTLRASLPVTAATCALVAGALLQAGCAAPRSPMDGQVEPPRSEIGSRAGSYALATTADGLKRLIAEDLEAGEPDRVYEGLNAFVGENDSRGTTKRAYLIWEEVRPVTMLQYGGGRSRMTGAKQLGELLRNSAERETAAAFDSLRSGDLERVRELRDNPMGIFSAETARLSKEVRPYAMLADGVLRYRDLASAPEPSEQELQGVLDVLNAAQSELAGLGDGEATFLADTAAAQSLERAGQIDAAAEYWMRIAASPRFAAQPDVLRNLVAARIKSHSVRLKERLILEVEEERRQEIRALSERYDTRVAGIEAEHGEFETWARAGFETTGARLASLEDVDARQADELRAVAERSRSRDAELLAVSDTLSRELARVDVSMEGVSAVVADQGQAIESLLKLTDEQRAALEKLDRMSAAQREKIEGLSTMTSEQREEIYRLNQATAEERAALEEMTAALAAQAEAKAAIEEAVAALDVEVAELASDVEASRAAEAEARARTARSEAQLQQALLDVQSYRRSVEELTASAGVEAVGEPSAGEGAGAEVSPALDPAAEGEGASTEIPARLSMDALPDLFALLGGAGESMKGAMGTVSSFIVAR